MQRGRSEAEESKTVNECIAKRIGGTEGPASSSFYFPRQRGSQISEFSFYCC
jgi:hypothetical protein